LIWKGGEPYLLDLVYQSVLDVDVDSVLEVEVFAVEVDERQNHVEGVHIRVLLDKALNSVAATAAYNQKQDWAMVYTPSQPGLVKVGMMSRLGKTVTWVSCPHSQLRTIQLYPSFHFSRFFVQTFLEYLLYPFSDRPLGK
jgi:hypothetical protein